MSCAIEEDFGDFLIGIGKLKFPLNRVSMVRVQNENILLTSRLGNRYMEVKFQKNAEILKPLFEINLAAYVSEKQNIIVEM
jgi:hypothetical protein